MQIYLLCGCTYLLAAHRIAEPRAAVEASAVGGRAAAPAAGGVRAEAWVAQVVTEARLGEADSMVEEARTVVRVSLMRRPPPD